MWWIECPLIPGRFVGRGDVTVALLLARFGPTPESMGRVINTLCLLILRTTEPSTKVTVTEQGYH